MFSELEALVAIAETGSMERAAAGLYITPSALTRRIQRLEAELGLVLLDRHFKPPRLTRAGTEVLEKTRSILSSCQSLKASSANISSTAGPFRLGLSHAIARPELANTILDLGRHFPLLQPNISNDVTPNLLERVRAGDLDMAVILLPAATPLDPQFKATTLSHEIFRLLQARTASRRKSAKKLEPHRSSWILNSPGCLVREQIKMRVEKSGAPFKVAAELNNPDLQLELVAGQAGLGIMQESILRKHPLRARLSVVDQPDYTIPATVIAIRGSHLGSRDLVAAQLERLLVTHFRSTARPS